jgi:hypothetical protein
MDQFNRKKRELRELYKRYKAGLVTEEQMTEEQKRLLRIYYGL